MRQNKLITPTGVICSNSACAVPITAASLQTQLEIQVRAHIAKFYQGWMVCDDVVCGKRTRMMRVYGRRCLSPGCRGIMSFEVSLIKHGTLVFANPFIQYDDTKLYNQLLFYSSLFDRTKILTKAKGQSKYGAHFITCL